MKTFFEENGKLEEMLSLRKSGASCVKLGQHYGCDHTTILDACKRHDDLYDAAPIVNVPPELQMKKDIVASQGWGSAAPPHSERRAESELSEVVLRVRNERLNPGTNYARYLRNAGIKIPKYNRALRI